VLTIFVKVFHTNFIILTRCSSICICLAG